MSGDLNRVGDDRGICKAATERDLGVVAREVVALFRRDADHVYVRASAELKATATEAELHRLAQAYLWHEGAKP